MSYVQGTIVQVWADLEDPDTGLAIDDADEVVLVVTPPAPLPAYIRQLSDAGVVHQEETPGRYMAEIDTTPAYGTWRYQFSTEAGGKRVVKRADLNVAKALVAAP
jgi:hypothetical protein